MHTQWEAFLDGDYNLWINRDGSQVTDEFRKKRDKEHKKAIAAIAAWECPNCGKKLTEVDGWYRCPDGAIYGNPIEFKIKTKIVYREI